MVKQLFSIGTVFLFVTVFWAFSLFQTVEAKVLPQAKTGGKTITTASRNIKTSGIGVSPKMRKDRRALIINFSNLQNASAVSYLLTYKTNGQDEGAMGGLNLNGSTNQASELLFGTCSKNVCRYHTNIKGAKLEVNYTTKAGKKYLRKYKIKV